MIYSKTLRRGTTPTFDIEAFGVDASKFDNVYITFEQGDVEITKTNEDIDRLNGIFRVRLTQEETLRFAVGTAKVQLRGMIGGSAVASTIGRVNVKDVLKEGVIE